MSKNRIPECVNEVLPNYNLPDLNNFIELGNYSDISPIDEFKARFKSIIQLANPNFFNEYNEIATSMLLSLISLTENYFRNIISRCILICPVAQKASASQNINLGSVLWHGANNLIHGISENTSFASGSEIKSISSKFIGFQVQKNSLLDSVLNEFDKICHFRHAVVHSDGNLAGKNATALSLTKVEDKVSIKLDYHNFQEISALCLTLVTNYNDELFKEISDRWAVVRRREFGLDNTNEREEFIKIWNLFLSTLDESNNTIRTRLTLDDCISQIKSIYQV
ncbi:hypothetical protein ACFSY7_02545 [Kurthia populi]|uniref:Apea-like HEPN domain-containing protein n=1 Tax=Kurthia populi TaxID=1562132 RepID=A0ABW5XWK1_9BACL